MRKLFIVVVIALAAQSGVVAVSPAEAWWWWLRAGTKVHPAPPPSPLPRSLPKTGPYATPLNEFKPYTVPPPPVPKSYIPPLPNFEPLPLLKIEPPILRSLPQIELIEPIRPAIELAPGKFKARSSAAERSQPVPSTPVLEHLMAAMPSAERAKLKELHRRVFMVEEASDVSINDIRAFLSAAQEREAIHQLDEITTGLSKRQIAVAGSAVSSCLALAVMGPIYELQGGKNGKARGAKKSGNKTKGKKDKRDAVICSEMGPDNPLVNAAANIASITKVLMPYRHRVGPSSKRDRR